MGHTAGRLIGREAPLAQLGDAVARARDGVSTTVLIEADAGIGKSRLVADGLSTFRDPKDAVAVGYGVELAGGAIRTAPSPRHSALSSATSVSTGCVRLPELTPLRLHL